MNILVVQETDWIRKGPLQQHHLMERLQKRGHNIQVIDFDPLWRESYGLYSSRKVFHVSRIIDNIKLKVIRPAFIKLPLVVYFTAMLTHANEIIRQVKEFNPNIVIGFDIPNSYIAFKICEMLGIPSVYYVIDINYLFVPEKALQIIAKAIEFRTVKMADAIIAINDELKRFYIEKMGASPSRSYVIRAGIDTQRFNPYIDGTQIREIYGIKKDEVVLFFMGWLYTFSGLKEVAISLSRYKSEPRIKLLVVGRGELYEELLRIKSEKLRDNLILVNWQPYDKIPKYVAASDICLLPAYDNEVMRHIVPIKMYEYMACGKPVIATRLPGIMKEFGKGNGVIYVKKPEDVLKKAVELAEDRQKLRKLGMKAAEYVQRYSWEVITDQFERLLKELVKNKGTT